jgi:hypothetical protein
VFYEYDPANDQGYIYLPGKTDEWYRLNVGTIFRGVEGNWFFARDAWERIARPLITRAKGTAVSKSRLERSPGAPRFFQQSSDPSRTSAMSGRRSTGEPLLSALSDW